MNQAIFPMLAYEDGNAAMDWLVRVFQFSEIERWLDDAGGLSHGELAMGDQSLFLAEFRNGYQSPKSLAASYPAAERWLQTPYILNGCLVLVGNVDEHFEHARQEGAKILSQPEDTPHGRIYRAADLEGQRWMFSQRSV
jgi:uncharacterized glyoxalase superfamily protein PhnB